jgi:hypothetical protein
MMTWLQDLPWLATIVAIAIAIWTVRMKRRTASQQRIRRLELAAELLREHAITLDAFLGDPAAPQVLKWALLTLSDAMDDKDIVKEIAKQLSKAAPPQTESGIALRNEFEALMSRSPTLAEAFTRSLTLCLCAGLLRWPETAKYFDCAMSHAASGSSVDMTAQVVSLRSMPTLSQGTALASEMAA